ncbi:MAG: hypothetical protein LBT95_02520 [Treponema sp.]|jgi:hypothetical protein|nr:hypothetical protein [Treponema sp.]
MKERFKLLAVLLAAALVLMACPLEDDGEEGGKGNGGGGQIPSPQQDEPAETPAEPSGGFKISLPWD